MFHEFFLRGDVLQIKKEITDFFHKELPEKDIFLVNRFPLDFWKRMGKAGLLGLNLPREYGGREYSDVAMIFGGEELIRRGASIGFVLSWVLHHVLSKKLILEHGDSQQKSKYLSDFAKGEKTAALAFGEKNAQGSLSGMKSFAEKAGENFRLKARKDFITNGGIADYFVLCLRDNEEKSPDNITAFIVERDEVNSFSLMEYRYLLPSLHYSIEIDSLQVSKERIIGSKGKAHSEMLKPMRLTEDIYMAGPILGCFSLLLEILKDRVYRDNLEISFENQGVFGGLLIQLENLRLLAYSLAEASDNQEIFNLLYERIFLSFRNGCSRFLTDYEDLLSVLEIKPETDHEFLLEGGRTILSIAKGLMRSKQSRLGKDYLVRS